MYPFAIAVYYSFTNYRIVSPTFETIGFRNYAKLFADPNFWEAMGNTLFFALVALVVELTLGFLIALPFLVLDMVVSSVLTSMSMITLPPVVISLPLKLMLFVVVDGWHLIISSVVQTYHIT